MHTLILNAMKVILMIKWHVFRRGTARSLRTLENQSLRVTPAILNTACGYADVRSVLRTRFICVLYTSVALKHAASAAPRLDTRPHIPCGIIALHPTIDPRRRRLLRTTRLFSRNDQREKLVPANKKERTLVVVELKRNRHDREWRAKTKNDRNRTLREGEKVRGTIIDLPLKSARWMTLFKSNGKKTSHLSSAPFFCSHASPLVPYYRLDTSAREREAG